jgi:hypothetical protein
MEQQMGAMEKQLALQKERAVQNIMRRWRSGTSTAVFKGWRKFAHEQASHKKALLTKTMTRLVNGSIWRAYRVWNVHVDTLRVESLQSKMEQQMGTMERQMALQRERAVQTLMRRWRSGTSTHVFGEWRKWARTQAAHKKQLLTKTMTRLVNSSLWLSWRGWQRHVSENEVAELKRVFAKEREAMYSAANNRKQIAAAQIIRKLRQGCVSTSFREWRTVTKNAQKRRKELLTTTLRRLINNNLFTSFRHWGRQLEEQQVASLQAKLAQEKHKRAHAMIKRWRMQTIVPVFKAWKEHARDRKEHTRDLLAKMLRRFSNKHVWACWREWSLQVKHARTHELQAKHGKEVAQLRALLNSQKRSQTQHQIKAHRYHIQIKCFSLWKQFTEKTRERQKALLTNVLHKLSNANIWQAWRVWSRSAVVANAEAVTARNEELRTELRKQMEANSYLYKVIEKSIVS